MRTIRVYKREEGKRIPKKLRNYFERMHGNFELVRDLHWDLNKAFELIRKEDCELRSIFLAVENLEYSLWRRKKYVHITRRKVPSILKQKMIELSFKDRAFPEKVDKYCKGLKGKELDECIDKLIEKFYKEQALEILEAEYQEIYPRSWKEKMMLINRERWKFFYERRCKMKPLFESFDWRNDWVQIFIIEHENGIHWEVGGSASTGKRTTHSYYGELFCKVQKELKDIPLVILWYDHRNNFLYIDELKSFAICPREMWGKEEVMKGLPKIIFDEDYEKHKNSRIIIYTN